MQTSQALLSHVLHGIVRYAVDSTGGQLGAQDDLRERAYFVLELVAFSAGHNLMQRCLLRDASPASSFRDDLDLVKYVCRHLWPFLFSKPIDSLKTNHRVCRALMHADAT